MRIGRKICRLFSLALVGIAGAVGGCLAPTGEPLDVVPNVEIERYLGKWYEIAKYPVSFEAGCYGVTADYSLREDGNVRVLNTCYNSDGSQIKNQIEGFAEISDKETNAKLTVYFFYPFGAPYWIIELDDDYKYAVVGDPTRRYLWILSRTPTMDDVTYNGILDRLPAKGYDPTKLERMTQFPEISR